MPRISAKKQLEMEEQKRREAISLKTNTTQCSNLMMQVLELEYDKMGFIQRYDDVNDELSEFVFEGKKCKYIDALIDTRCEMPFDPYNNVKLACGLVQFYINDYIGMDTLMIYLTNKSMNEEGQAVVKFDNGEEIVSNTYCKDSLKYLDLVLKMSDALPPFFSKLKGLDMSVPFKR